MNNRRTFLKSAATLVAGAGVAASGYGDDLHSCKHRPTYILVHGSWHGSWCFERLTHLMTEQGFAVITRDLPGSGLNAQFPVSYYARPFDPAAFATEISPVADVTLSDYVRQVTATIDELFDAGSGPVILVGHSMAGVVLSAVGELLGWEKIDHLVYLTAYMVRNGVPAINYDLAGAGSLVFSLFLADPTVIGALRVDPNSPDPAYRAALRATLYGDVPVTDIPGIANLLTPDQPVDAFVEPVTLTTRWAAIPRTYITCSADNTIPLAIQQQFIREADLDFPGTRTHVVNLTSSHSAFFSQPAALAQVLAEVE